MGIAENEGAPPRQLRARLAMAGARTWIAALGIAALCLIGGSALAQIPAACGSLARGDGGPHDYRTARGAPLLQVVESNHFTSNVENLIRGITGPLGSEIDFVLRSFPNHHRALMSMMRLGEKLKTTQVTGANYTVECYFQRALLFKSDDTTARMIYAMYLGKNANTAEATRQLDYARSIAGDNPFTHYNIGLIYFDLKEFDQALAQAHKAAELGFTRTELQDQLKSVGKWKEPEGQAAKPAGEAASTPETTAPAAGPAASK